MKVIKFYIRRFVTLIITLFFVTLLTFIAFSVIPGDGALSKLSIEADYEAVEALRESLGLNQSIPLRYINYIKGVFMGDLGKSIQYGIPVKTLIGERLPITVWLAVLSMVMIITLSIPLGILSSIKKDGAGDKIITFSTQIFMSIPAFFLGIIITIIFGISLKWFVPGAYIPMGKSISGFFKYMIYPAIAVAVPKIAMTVKFLRSSILRELKSDYVRTARSKGGSRLRVLFKHVLKNAMIPVITFLGMVAADVLAGSIVIEQVFNLPGIGRLLIAAISNRDYPVVQAIILYIAAVVVVINFCVDITYKRLDPRVRLAN